VLKYLLAFNLFLFFWIAVPIVVPTEMNWLLAQQHKGQEKIKVPEGMVLIPDGDFEAGLDPNLGYEECLKYAQSCEREWFDHIGPVHMVWVDAFFMDKYEVTQKEFEPLMGKNPSKFKGDDLPVERVLWTEANEYCEKVGKRLPTEAEWEKAAKGRKDTLYPWGNEILSAKANFCDVRCKKNIRATRFEDGYEKTSPVGSYPPNGYGLYDMAGNVWEWVADWFDKDYYKKSPRKNPKGPPMGMKKVLRGGSWGNNASALGVATRSWAHNNRVSRRGFRCAADVSQESSSLNISPNDLNK
ncbi:MAG: formylglycine-generating enzyme family protein, partial [Nitrospinales bacterium]